MSSPSRRPLIAGNWKMHKTHLEAIVLVQQLAHELDERDLETVEVAILPPFTSLRTLQTLIDSERYPFALGAQHVFPEREGAYTGEVSPPMLKALDCKFVITGHSERRQYFGETDDGVRARVQALWKEGLVPIVCVGETEQERDQGKGQAKVEGQITRALKGLAAERVAETVVAYEPVWAIGTGRTASPRDAEEMALAIRETIAREHGNETAARVRILYGGSVKAGNARAITAGADVDGALVGGASLDAVEFARIIKGARS